MPFYDHTNQSLHTSLTADELKNNPDFTLLVELVGDDGLHISTESAIKHRHELAHFYSYNASGLHELYEVIHAYKRTVLREAIVFCKNDINADGLSVCVKSVEIKNAITQLDLQEAFLFGYGSIKSLRETFNPHTQIAFLNEIGYPKEKLRCGVVGDYLDVLDQMLLTSTSELVDLPFLGLPRTCESVLLSSRSVIEAYAITAETVAEYIKRIIFSENKSDSAGHHNFRENKKRIPAAIDSVALEMCISTLCKDRISVSDYVNFVGVRPELYWGVALLTFSAMQVPVAHGSRESALVMGGVMQLSTAHRFAKLINNISKGIIRNPVEVGRGDAHDLREDNLDILSWMDEAHKSIGDNWSLKFTIATSELREALGQITSYDLLTSGVRSAVVAKSSLWSNPYLNITEPGVCGNLYPLYIITSDNKVMCSYDLENENLSIDLEKIYTMDSWPNIYKAILSEDHWDAVSSRMYPNAESKFRNAVKWTLSQALMDE